MTTHSQVSTNQQSSVSTSSVSQPRWWKRSHTSAWERAKEALRRDWEQTKADLEVGGTYLNQDVDDTLLQAVGAQSIPPRYEPNLEEGVPGMQPWDTVEPAVRYGFGARHHFRNYDRWNPELESRLRADWPEAESGSTWEQVKAHVRRGWDSVRRAVA
jgi:hypothetical protein